MTGKAPVRRELTEAVKAVRRKNAGKAVAVKTLNPELEAILPEMFEAMRNGESVTSVARRHGLNPGSLRSYAWRNHRDVYEVAQQEGADLLAERALEASENRNETEETIETTFADGSVTRAVKRFDNVQRSKIAAEGLWKMAAVKNPEKYGTKAQGVGDTDISGAIIEARKRVSS